MKKKVKDLTISEIIEISNEYREDCTRCPLYPYFEIHCMTFCELPRNKQITIEQELEREIEVKECDYYD